MRLIDNSGKMVWTESAAFDDAGKMNIKTTSLPAGVYILDVRDNAVILGKQRIAVY